MTATFATQGDTIRFVTHGDGTAHLMFRDPRTGWGEPIPMVAADPAELTDPRPDSRANLLALGAAGAERARAGGGQR